MDDLQKVKKIVRALLLSAKHGLTLNELCNDYTKLEYKTLPYKEFGYNSAIDMMKDMPDVVKVIFKSNGTMIFKGVADESTVHISKLVSQQKSSGRKSNIVICKQVRPTKVIVPDFIRVKISEIIRCFPKGCSMKTFESCYQNRYRKKLDPLLLGLPTLKALLDLCPDIVSTRKHGSEIFIYDAAKESGKYILKTPMQDTIKSKVLVDEKPKIKSGIPENIKKEIYVVLSKSSTGIWSVQFPIKFKEVHKKEFDFQQLGFGSIIEVMSKLTNLVLIERPVPTGDWILKAIHHVKNVDENLSKPVDVVPPHSNYTSYDPGSVGELIEICLSHIINPSSFWFQCVVHLEQLWILTNDMEVFYQDEMSSKGYEFTLNHLKTEKICCAQFEDKKWYRAIIKNILSPHEIQVFYVDFGNEMVVDIAHLRLLRKDFLILPAVAVFGSLDGVVPLNLKTWSEEAIKRFFDLTKDIYLYGKIISKEKSISLEIVDTNGNNDVYIADSLLENGFAAHPSELITTQKGTNQTSVSQLNSRDSKKYLEPVENIQNEITKNEIVDLVKNFHVDEDLVFTVIHYKEQAWLSSLDISRLFWDGGDILRQMLRQKKLSLESVIISNSEDEELFSMLRKMNSSETGSGLLFRSHITIYKVASLLQICALFKCKKENYLAAVNQLIREVEDKQYWKRKLNENEMQEEATKFKLTELMFKRRRLHYAMMTNTASAQTFDELRAVEKEIKDLKSNLKQI